MAKRNDTREFSFLEPFGHKSLKSKFERYWDKFNGPFGLFRKRVTQFSVYAGMTYFPVQYKMRQFTLDSTLPNEDWIHENFRAFVKTEFSGASQDDTNYPKGWPVVVDHVLRLPEQFLNDFLVKSEWTGRINIKLPNENSPEEIATCLFDLLCNPKVGSSKNADHNDRNQFMQWVVPTIREKSRLLFIIPGFPFKDQNRFRVPYDGSYPDLGEIAFLIRLFNLTQTMYQVHPYGVDIVILTDGELYREIFGIPKTVVSTYLRRLLSYRRTLNIQGAVSFISLKELIDRAGDSPSAWEIVKSIRFILEKKLLDGEDEFNKSFQALVSGMKWNFDTRNNYTDIPDEHLWKILRGAQEDVDSKYKDTWDQVNNRATHAALEYASVNLMLRWTNLISKFFPEAIRGTVHPKTGQFAFAGSGLSFAWNGIASSKSWPRNIDDIRVVPYMSLSDFSTVRLVELENTGLPLFFTASMPNETIEAAKSVLKKDGWQLDDITGREFKQSDLVEFIELGLGDVDYSWEREIQTEEYFTALFQFRMSHYSKYGFGIHGLWLEGSLIGQFGLQVLSEEEDQLELVLFLGREYTRKGVGSRLCDYVIRQCKSLGISYLYGVVRPDNLAGQKLLQRFDCERHRTVKHFNQEGILYRINIKGG